VNFVKNACSIFFTRAPLYQNKNASAEGVRNPERLSHQEFAEIIFFADIFIFSF